jgi:endonuclease YncB( thermonuclease family)
MKPLNRIYIAVLFALLGVAVVVNRSPQTLSHMISWLLPTAPGKSQHYEMAAERTIDGDTLAVINGRGSIEIDLCGIKAADQTEAVAAASKDTLRRLVSRGRGSQVTLVFTDAKPQNRQMAEAFLPTANADAEIHLSSQMLLEGMATVDPQSVDSCPNGSRLRVAEAEAKQQAAGLWARPVAKKG